VGGVSGAVWVLGVLILCGIWGFEGRGRLNLFFGGVVGLGYFCWCVVFGFFGGFVVVLGVGGGGGGFGFLAGEGDFVCRV